MINEYDFTVMMHVVDGPIDVGKKGANGWTAAVETIANMEWCNNPSEWLQLSGGAEEHKTARTELSQRCKNKTEWIGIIQEK